MTSPIRSRYACYFCDSLGGGRFKDHEVETNWYIGHLGGQAHHACEECMSGLHEPELIASDVQL